MDIEEIEDLVSYNLSFGISIKKTLEDIKRLDLLEFFKDYSKSSSS
tara:strand:+ start:914 stop:1051 length:138 start_codon:yes stop_codon:yes gene_type:complete